MKNIYLCRHGQTDWNLVRRIQGRTDIELNETGIAQAHALAEFFVAEKPIADIVVSSPLKRAHNTAEIIADALGLECVVDEDLNEINTGRFTGCSMDELLSDPEWQAHLVDPWETGYGKDGEPADSVRERMIRVLNRYENAILVSHASPIRHAIMYLLDIPHQHLYHIQIQNAAATYFMFRNGHIKLAYLNQKTPFNAENNPALI